MIRAGLLREIVSIYKYEDVQTPSGELTREKILVTRCRAELMVQNGHYIEKHPNEEFDDITVTFRIRANYAVKDDQILDYHGQTFRISFVYEDQHTREMRLTCNKINL